MSGHSILILARLAAAKINALTADVFIFKTFEKKDSRRTAALTWGETDYTQLRVHQKNVIKRSLFRPHVQ
jgi:hypothetical protein